MTPYKNSKKFVHQYTIGEFSSQTGVISAFSFWKHHFWFSAFFNFL